MGVDAKALNDTYLVRNFALCLGNGLKPVVLLDNA